MRLFPAAFALALLSACPVDNKGETGPYCEDTKTDIALDEVTPIGITAADVIADAAAEETAVFTYVDDATTDLTLGFVAGTGARFVDSEAVYPETDGPQPAIAVICDDRIEVDGTFSFATADGAFAESFSSVLNATAERTYISQALDLDGLAGTFDLVPFVDAEDYDALEAWIDVVFTDGVSAGAVNGQASGEDECADADECTAWATNVEVGTWGPASE